MGDETVKSKKKQSFTWLLGVVLPCLITSYTSYRKAKVEVEATASAGYSTLLESQKELQKAVELHIKEDMKESTAATAQVAFLREMVLRLYEVGKERHRTELNKPLPAPPVGKTTLKIKTFKSVPATLEAAAKQVDMMQHQQMQQQMQQKQQFKNTMPTF